MAPIAKRVARVAPLEPDHRGDVPGKHFLDILSPIRVHPHQPTGTLHTVSRGVLQTRPHSQVA